MKNTSIRVDDDVWEWLQALPGKTVNDKLIGLLRERAGAENRDELLDLVRSLPDGEDMRLIVDEVMTRKIEERRAARPTVTGPGFDPASVSGVQVGAANLRPHRETGTERAAREGRERQDRAQALDPVSDPSIDRSDEFVSA